MINLKRTVNCASLADGSFDGHAVGPIVPIAPAVPYQRYDPVYCDTSEATSRASDAVAAYFAQKICKSHPIQLFSFPNSYVFGQGSVALADKTLLIDSAIEFLAHNIAPDGCTRNGDHFELSNSGDPQHLSGTALLVKRPWYKNFGHWLVDLAPILLLASEKKFKFDAIILGKVDDPALEQMMRDLVRQCARDSKLVFHEDDCVLTVDNLLYMRPVHIPPLYKHPLSVQATRQNGLMRVASKPTSRRLVYVDRQHVHSRGIANHQVVLETLLHRGFESVRPEIFSFLEQVEIFNQADVIVGVKGAALTNAMFCNPGALVIVLSPSDFPDPFFWDLVSPLGIRYAEIFCRTIPETVISPSHCHFVVEPNALSAALGSLGL